LIEGTTCTMSRVFLIFVLFTFLPSAAHAEKRIALLIGNKDYKTGVGALTNPLNDIRIVGEALKAVGFEVLKPAQNARRADMLIAIHDLASKLKNAGADAVGFLYYSGHGIASAGENYLIPVDVEEPSTVQLTVQGVKQSEVLAILRNEAPNAAHYVVLDACRNTLQGARGGKGFLPVGQQSGVLVAFAAEPGKTASDLGRRSGPYAAALAAELVRPGQNDLLMFHNVRVAVIKKTGGDQVPWTEDGIQREQRIMFGGEAKPGHAPPGGNSASVVPPSQCPGLELTVDSEHKCIHPLDEFMDCSFCPRLVLLQGGTFTIGSPPSELGRDTDEEPLTDVTIRPFAIGRYEVTRSEWSRCVEGGACAHKVDPPQILTPDLPANSISWQDAKEFLRWLSSLTNARYRLPSEAEWEYAARSGVSAPRFWGFSPADACSYANVGDKSLASATPDVPLTADQQQLRRIERGGSHDCTDGFAGMAPVGSFKPNRFGLNDMLGNLWEWVEDCAFPNYRPLPRNGDPYVEQECKVGNLRGGSYLSGPASVRSANRFQGGRSRLYAQPDFGFRVARDTNP
jgi:formylglycine-generating enzyme required for sulfatase activity